VSDLFRAATRSFLTTCTFSTVDSKTPQHMREQLQWWLKGANDDKSRIGLVLQATLKGSGDKVKAGI
jgi:hypothetical protein